MKVVRFLSEKESYGVLLENHKVLDIQKTEMHESGVIPASIEEFIALGEKRAELMKKAIEDSQKNELDEALTEMENIQLLAPLTKPPKIICLGLNYRDHAEEAKMKIPHEPVLFMKPRTAIVGPEDYVVKPTFVKQLDYEGELAIIISKKGKNIPLYASKDHIFGYTILNDISARDLQFKNGQWTRGKSFDTFAPIGPCITTTAQIHNPNHLQLQTKVNGEIRQDSSTELMVFNVDEILYHISRVMTLEPCDIIATGTPAGVAAFRESESKYLRAGDIVEVMIEDIGVLRNKIIYE